MPGLLNQALHSWQQRSESRRCRGEVVGDVSGELFTGLGDTSERKVTRKQKNVICNNVTSENDFLLRHELRSCQLNDLYMALCDKITHRLPLKVSEFCQPVCLCSVFCVSVLVTSAIISFFTFSWSNFHIHTYVCGPAVIKENSTTIMNLQNTVK